MSDTASETTSLLPENPYQKAVDQHVSDVPTSGRENSNSTQSSSKINTQNKKNVIGAKLGPNMVPQRTSRVTQKLKLLPESSIDYGEQQELDKASTLKQYSLQKIKDRNARKDAERLGKKHRSMLPRVTTYCTAGSYKMRDFIRWLKDKRRIHSTAPKLFDECIYTPFMFKDWRRNSSGTTNGNNGNNNNFSKKEDFMKQQIQLDDEGGLIDFGKMNKDLFIFEYGVIVMWGFSKREERMLLLELAKFENEKLADEDVQKEEFNYYITQSYQPRIYNDFITLRDDGNFMIKLSISYAISQSVKISLFEELVDNTIEDTQDIPQQISQTGKVKMTREEIMKSIGELFILRININLHGSILDSPELMWSEPELEPIYQATRGYLEINQRVALLNQRLEIISDLLQMLKEQLGHNNDEQLELTVILLIGAEVLISLINIIVDLYSQRKA
ncbi:hypothetical protein CANINC_002191 [Pichia inconspicua]|uniref:DUF155 domain-containing protein n=1 Tax=Pichia inconspicua TaxID=52247 RepID=A0A4T0X1M5_9ASCO|nr:hypothetical protein CANINC_002191 [[Candida] inconspicua]